MAHEEDGDMVEYWHDEKPNPLQWLKNSKSAFVKAGLSSFQLCDILSVSDEVVEVRWKSSGTRSTIAAIPENFQQLPSSSSKRPRPSARARNVQDPRKINEKYNDDEDDEPASKIRKQLIKKPAETQSDDDDNDEDYDNDDAEKDEEGEEEGEEDDEEEEDGVDDNEMYQQPKSTRSGRTIKRVVSAKDAMLYDLVTSGRKRTSSRSSAKLRLVKTVHLPSRGRRNGQRQRQQGNDDDNDDGQLLEESSNEDEDEPKRSRKKGCQHLKNSLDPTELITSDEQCLMSLAGYRNSLQPFVSARSFRILESTAETMVSNKHQHHRQQPRGGAGRPRKDKEEREEPDGDDDSNDSVAITQPSTVINVTMRSYQLEGLSWLVSHYHRCLNCILADEMGLGKTLQSISFIAHTVHVQKHSGLHLVVVPLSVLFNWMSEFKKFCPTLKVLRLHSNDTLEQARLKALIHDETKTQVAVTTYDTLKNAHWQTFLRRIIWRTVILDDGHRIKDEDSNVAHACCGLRARFKVNTPVNTNNLLHFLSTLSLTNFPPLSLS